MIYIEQSDTQNTEVHISPYDENEKRVINGKIVNVTYHKIDWAKNFAAMCDQHGLYS